MTKLNYQQIYEEEVSLVLNVMQATDLKWSQRYYELSDHQRRLVEAMIDAGYQRAVTDAMDPEVLEETAVLSVDMAEQLTGFSNMIKSYLHITK